MTNNSCPYRASRVRSRLERGDLTAGTLVCANPTVQVMRRVSADCSGSIAVGEQDLHDHQRRYCAVPRSSSCCEGQGGRQRERLPMTGTNQSSPLRDSRVGVAGTRDFAPELQRQRNRTMLCAGIRDCSGSTCGETKTGTITNVMWRRPSRQECAS